MSEADLANAAWWAWLWDEVEKWAFFGVVVALAIEFGALRFGAPHKKTLEAAKDLKIAELNNETARLRKQVSPRTIDGEAFKNSLEGKPKPNAPIEIMFPREDGEAFRLAIQLRDVLRYSGWQASEPVPVPPGDVPRLQSQPSVASFGSYSGTGVVVVVRADTQEQFDAVRDFQASTPLNALVGALSQALGSAGSAAAGPDVFHVPAPGVLRIVIGTKQ